MTTAKRLFRSVLEVTGIFLGLLVVLTILVNWPAVAASAEYELNPPHTQTVTTTGPDAVIIPSLAIEAPLSWNQPFDAIPDALERGTAHLANTALPGETGNSVIIGHSSDYSWKNNPYAAVFATLPHIKKGADISFRRNGTLVHYTVTSSKVVSADDTAVIAPTKDAELTLITCYPIGTAWKRYIVTAALVGTATPAAEQTPSQTDFAQLPLR